MSAFSDIKMHGNGQIGKKGCRQKKGMSGKLADIDMLARHVADMSPTFPTKHFIHDPVPIGLRLAGNTATEQLISLLGLLDSNILLGLEGFLEIAQFLVSCFFLARSPGNSSRGLISFLTATKAAKASMTSAAVPFCSTRRRMAMTRMRYSSLLLVPYVGIWNFVLLGSSTLICSVSRFS